jgi:hypothetical protein
MHLPLTRFIDDLREREAAAVARLTAAAAGQSLCVVSRRGDAASPLKYHEGAVAALAQVRRSVRSIAPEGSDEDQHRLAVARIHDTWLAQSQSPARTSPGWESYLNGGLDALEQLSSALVR